MKAESSAASSTGLVEESHSTSLDEVRAIGPLYQDATVWVFIAAFIGLAIAWAGGGVPWIGALIGGGSVYLLGALVIASRG